ncbi:MAG: hypothetical protein MR842_12945 [Clostridiales bacterium]|nr:hypothetical protein [Clostridiales bacterium]MDY4007253.1 hypothetical protein [Candidatus Limiplasma sp.]
MNQPDLSGKVRITVPIGSEYALVASMALCGLGMLAGLDVDMLGDLRTVAAECLDCLAHQSGRPESISMEAYVAGNRLLMRFQAQNRMHAQEGDALDLDFTRGVLETLVPDVHLDVDGGGVHSIECSMPV